MKKVLTTFIVHSKRFISKMMMKKNNLAYVFFSVLFVSLIYIKLVSAE